MKKTISLTLAALVFGTMAHASIIAAWENNHLAGDEASTTAGEAPSGGSYDAAGLAFAPVITRGAGANTTTYADTFGFRSGDEASLVDAITNDRYLTWTIQPSGGNQISYDSTDIRITTQNQPVDLALFSDATGTFADGNEIFTWNVANDTPAPPAQNIDLSAEANLQNVGGNVEFRLYYWGKTNQYAQIGIGSAFQAGDTSNDMVVNATISPIPEPSVVALLGLSVGFLIYYRRRR